LQVTGSFTFAFWVKVTAASDSIIILKLGASIEYLIGHSSSGIGFRMTVDGGTQYVSVGTPATLGTWYHVVAWFDSSDGKMRLRINDAATYVSSVSVTLIAPGTGSLGIGANPGGTANNPFTGVIDEIGFWKRVLTAVEITALYNGGAGLPLSSFTT
jgi:hypothetical protein